MNTHPSLDIVKDAVKEWKQYNRYYKDFGVCFSVYFTSKKRNFLELSWTDPNKLFDGIEKCYYNYVDLDETGFGAHWFYHKDFDYTKGHIRRDSG